jgi:hypothetical protein
MDPRVDLDAVAKGKIPSLPLPELNRGRPARSLVTILTEPRRPQCVLTVKLNISVTNMNSN